MSQMWMSHVTHVNESCPVWVSWLIYMWHSPVWVSWRNPPSFCGNMDVYDRVYSDPPHTATHCNVLQNAATQCSILQHTTTHCNTLQHTATHCNTLQCTAKHCSILQLSFQCMRAGWTPGLPWIQAMGWLRLVGSLKVYVSFAEHSLFHRALLQKRPTILRSLLIVATPHENSLYPLSSSTHIMYIPTP